MLKNNPTLSSTEIKENMEEMDVISSRTKG